MTAKTLIASVLFLLCMPGASRATPATEPRPTIPIATFRDADTQAFWCETAHDFRLPEEVLPYVPADTRAAALGDPTEDGRLRLLLDWLSARLISRDEATDGDTWQRPARTLTKYAGDCEDRSLVVWSALPLFDLEDGRFVIGEHGGTGHAWIELPKLGVLIESTRGTIHPLSERARLGYFPRYFITTSACRPTGTGR